MKWLKYLLFCIFTAFSLFVWAQKNQIKLTDNENYVITLQTSSGDIKFMLLNETPLHRDNFVKMAGAKFYDGVTFHRVIQNFMIQTGDPMTKIKKNKNDLSNRTIQAEITPQFFHFNGAVAAAREMTDNPNKHSSYCQFYIVNNSVGHTTANVLNKHKAKLKKRKAEELKETSDQTVEINDADIYSTELEARYMERGGYPTLDGDFTIFGYILEGIDVVTAIGTKPVGETSWPLEAIYINKVIVTKELRTNIDKNYNHNAK